MMNKYFSPKKYFSQKFSTGHVDFTFDNPVRNFLRKEAENFWLNVWKRRKNFFPSKKTYGFAERGSDNPAEWFLPDGWKFTVIVRKL